MKPEEDASWPICGQHEERHWCDFMRNWIMEGNDVGIIITEVPFSVPIVPSLHLYAGVVLSDPLAENYIYRLYLISSDPNSNDLIELGLFMKDIESRVTIAGVISEWTSIFDDKPCTSLKHGFSEEILFQRSDKTLALTKANSWCMAYYGCCYYCHRSAEMGGGGTAFTMPDASAVGIDPSDFRRSGGGNVNINTTVPARQYGREAAIREALNRRFQQRTSADNSWPGGAF